MTNLSVRAKAHSCSTRGTKTPAASIVGSAAALLIAASAVGCGGGGSGGGAGGNSGGGSLTYKACSEGTRAGGFAVQLIAATSRKPAYTSFGGGVRNGVDPREGRQQLAAEGNCVLTAAPSNACTPTCSSAQVCSSGQCVTPPTYQDLGLVTVTGLGTSVAVTSTSMRQYYDDLSDLTYPPFALDDKISLSTAGGAYAAFSLEGRGIEPLVFPGTGLQVGRSKALTATWTPPSKAGSTRVFVRLDISHHGGGSARIECDVPDTGSATIPATLIDQLIEKGTAGFPTLSLARRTMDSKMLEPGCVDLSVASPVEREVEVEGVTSCNCDAASECPTDDPKPCPNGQICRTAGTAGGLTCGPAT